jgi:hypothetical protein
MGVMKRGKSIPTKSDPRRTKRGERTMMFTKRKTTMGSRPK